MQTPNWNAIAAAPLPDDDQSSARLDAIGDRITALLYRGAEQAAAIDPELGDYFVDTMMQAFRGKA